MNLHWIRKYVKGSGFYPDSKDKKRMNMYFYYRNKPDQHIICYSYPNCEEAPLGCVVRNGLDAEPYGYRG